MLQNLTKGKMVEWVVLLVALVALGLSIAAVVKPCSSNFGDICKTVTGGASAHDSCEQYNVAGQNCNPNGPACLLDGTGCADCAYSPNCRCIDDNQYKSRHREQSATKPTKPTSVKPDFPKFVFMGNKCVQEPKGWVGTTYNTKFQCEKASGLIVGPGGQDSHPEGGKKPSDLPLILGLSGGGLVIVLAIAFLLMKKK